MRKSKLFLAALGALASTAVNAAETGFKSGFRAGVGAGYKSYKVTHNADVPSRDPFHLIESANFSSTKKTKTGLMDFNAAYDLFKDGYYVSGEINYRYSPGKNRTRILPQTGVARVPFTYEQTHQHDFGISGHLGGKISSNLVAYGILDLRAGRFKETFKNNDRAVPNISNASRTQIRLGYGGGIGLRYALPEYWSVAAEATYNTYQKIKIKGDRFSDIDTDIFASARKPKITNIIVKLSKTL